MNCFDSLGGNTCLWILILMLVLGSCNQGIEHIFSGCSIPILLGILFFLWKDGKIPCFQNCGCGCN